MLARLESSLEGLSRETPMSGWCVALSGGVDSVVLLNALVTLRRGSARWRNVALRAIHVNHGLRPEARAWARHCRALCRALDVPLSVRRVTVADLAGRSLEAEARRARYAALGRGLRRHEWLLTAHHEDDQLETQLLQWMRGAGVAGLAAMPPLAAFGRGALVRPLLGETRATLETWARARRLVWVDDDSNVDVRFDRNYLRSQVIPTLRARWPAATTVAARSAAHLREAREMLEALAQMDLASLGAEARSIEIAALAMLSPARQRNVLRHWLHREGLVPPDAVHLERIRSELPAARADANPFVSWAGGEVRRFRGRLYALAAIGAEVGARSRDGARRNWNWRRRKRFELGAGAGTLRLVADRHGSIDARSLPPQLWVGTRRGGERLAIKPGGARQTLKELLRSSAVPPWERERLPILYDGAQSAAVVAVADLFVAAAHLAHGDATPARSRFRLVWEGRFW